MNLSTWELGYNTEIFDDGRDIFVRPSDISLVAAYRHIFREIREISHLNREHEYNVADFKKNEYFPNEGENSRLCVKF